MYQIYAGGSLIHDMNLEDERFRISAADLEMELGKTGSLRFTIYPGHPGYDGIQPLKTLVTVSRKYSQIFGGRVLSVKYGFWGEKEVTCEGDLAFLLDSVIDLHSYSGSFSGYLDFVLGMHNKKVEPEKQIFTGRITVGEFSPYTVTENTEYKTVYDVLVERMANPSGGYLFVRYENGYKYLDLLSYFNDQADVSGQAIELETNLLDIQRESEGGDMFSAIVPLGAKLQNSDRRLDISTVNGGIPYITSAEAVKACGGTIIRPVVFDNITNATTLKTEGQRYLDNNWAGESTIEITAADLSGTSPDIDSYHLGQWVRVHIPHHFGYEIQLFQIRKMSVDLLDPAKNKIVIGAVRRGLTDTVGQMASGGGNQNEDDAVQPYVMESGTTGIWSWKIFSDNTCEFFGKVPITSADVTSALGSWYRGPNLYEATAYEYPVQMTEAPALNMTFQTRNGLAALLWASSPDAETAQRYLPQSFLIRPTTATGIFGNINIIAKGKIST